MMTVLAGAFLGGLLGSPHCVGMCGGFAAAATERPTAYHLGRLTTYSALGALAGASGAAIPGPWWLTGVVAGTMLVWFSARLAGIAPEIHLPWFGGIAQLGARFAQKDGLIGRYGLGLVTALLPCGLVWAALGIAVAGGSATMGASAMLAFGVGTVPLLGGVALGFRGVVARHRGARLALAGAVLVAGMWSIGTRLSPAVASSDGTPACHDE